MTSRENAWMEDHCKKKLNSQSWMFLYGPRQVITADWHIMEKSCPTWNTKGPPGHGKLGMPSMREEMAYLRIVIFIHFNSVTGFQE